DIDFGSGAGTDNTELQTSRARYLLLSRGEALGGEGHSWISRVHKYAENPRLGHKFRQELETFLVELGAKDRKACEIASRVSQAVGQAARDRVDSNDENNRD